MSLNNFVRYTQDLEKWKRHFINPTKIRKGKYRIVQNIPKINLVTPTQAAVEQAKSQLKAVEHLKTDKQPMKTRKREYKRKGIKSQAQSTSSSSQRRIKKKK